MHLLAPICVCLAALGCSRGGLPTPPPLHSVPEHRGLTADPETLGYVYLEGYVLRDRGGQGYGVRQYRNGGDQYLFLQRFTGRDSAGRAQWEVMDAIRVPAAPEGHSLVLGLCGRRGELDSDLIAIVRSTEDTQEWRPVWQAWRANPESGRFSLEGASEMYCLNEGYGV